MKISRAALALFFVFAGVMHFISPGPYLAIMPRALPWPGALVAITGLAEIVGGLGVLVRPTRKLAAWSLILLLLAVFPANIYAAQHGMNVSGWQVPAWLLWARLPLQAVLIVWVYFAALKDGKPPR
ncbi:MAG: DoxX family protein [Chthoniobacterales bacterium]